jgi:hypothetical protein
MGEGTAADRVKAYINGVQITEWDTEGTDTTMRYGDGSAALYVGRGGGGQYFNGYIAQAIVIDGTALEPTSFGEFNANGKWVPVDPSGLTFGTNGFHLKFGNTSDFGEDSSGNGNDFTAVSLAATAQVEDTPTDSTADGTGNYCTILPFHPISAYTVSNGNLETDAVGDAAWIGTLAVDVEDTDGFYFEVESTTANTYGDAGIQTVAGINSLGATALKSQNTGRFAYEANAGNFWDEGSSGAYGTSWTTANKVIGVFIRNGKLYFSLDGVLQNSANLTAETGFAKSGLTGLVFPRCSFSAGSGTKATWKANFGQRAWQHDPGGAYKAWSTANLPAPAIADPSAHFQSTLFTGTGAELAITLTDAAGNAVEPGFVWSKSRSNASSHELYDLSLIHI